MAKKSAAKKAPDLRLHAATVVPIAELKPHPRNYKKHPADQLAHLEASLKQYGQFRNVVVARDSTILAGHGVVAADAAAALELGQPRDDVAATTFVAVVAVDEDEIHRQKRLRRGKPRRFFAAAFEPDDATVAAVRDFAMGDAPRPAVTADSEKSPRERIHGQQYAVRSHRFAESAGVDAVVHADFREALPALRMAPQAGAFRLRRLGQRRHPSPSVAQIMERVQHDGFSGPIHDFGKVSRPKRRPRNAPSFSEPAATARHPSPSLNRR